MYLLEYIDRCCRELGLELHFRLNDNCSVFQAKIFTILKAIEAIASGPALYSESYVIFVYSQVALRTTASVWCKSHFVRECKAPLRTFRPDCIRLRWILGHSGILGN